MTIDQPANGQELGTPLWVAKLGATECGATAAAWEGWTGDIRTFCLTFDALYPQRNQQEWRANWHDEYGKPQLVASDGTGRTVVELEVVKSFRAAGWGAIWKDTWGKAPAWMKPWTRAEVPREISRILAAIRAEEPKAKPWDVLAWSADEPLFVECKAKGEKFTKAELAFVSSAIRVGVPLSCFAVLRGAINYPARDVEGP